MVWFEDNQILAEINNIKNLTPNALQDVTLQSQPTQSVAEPAETRERSTPQPITLLQEMKS